MVSTNLTQVTLMSLMVTLMSSGAYIVTHMSLMVQYSATKATLQSPMSVRSFVYQSVCLSRSKTPQPA